MKIQLWCPFNLPFKDMVNVKNTPVIIEKPENTRKNANQFVEQFAPPFVVVFEKIKWLRSLELSHFLKSPSLSNLTKVGDFLDFI